MKTKRVIGMFAAMMMVVTMSVVTVNAQTEGDKAVGASIAFGSGDSYSNMGIEGKFLYNLTDPIRLGCALTYFLKKDDISYWDFSAYGHYLVNLNNKLIAYPLVGLGVYGYNSKINESSSSGSDLAISLGGGLEYKLSARLALNAELKYKIIDNMNRLIVSAGFNYKF